MKVYTTFLYLGALAFSFSLFAMDRKKTEQVKRLELDVWVQSLTSFVEFGDFNRDSIKPSRERYIALLNAKNTAQVSPNDKKSLVLKTLSRVALQLREEEIQNSNWYYNAWGCTGIVSLLATIMGMCIVHNNSRELELKTVGVLGTGLFVTCGALYKAQVHGNKQKKLSELFEYMQSIKDKLHEHEEA